MAGCGKLFIYSNARFLGNFAYSIAINSAFFAEVMAAIIAIEKAVENRWNFLWLKTDSSFQLSSAKYNPVIKGLIILQERNDRLMILESRFPALAFQHIHIFSNSEWLDADQITHILLVNQLKTHICQLSNVHLTIMYVFRFASSACLSLDSLNS